MKKIGIDARMFSSKFTGIGRYTYELIKNLLTIDKENQYVLFFNDPEYDACPYTSSQIKKVRVNAKHYSLTEQTRFLKILLDEKLDLMHFTHFNAPIFYTRPSVVTIHDLTLSFFPGKKMTSFVYRKGYEITISSIINKAKAIIAVSNNTKNDLEHILPQSRGKIHVIYEATDPMFHHITDKKFLEEIKTKYALTKPFLLYTGVWRDHKNLVGLIKAFHKLRTQYSCDYDLVLTGKEDPYYPEVKETIEMFTLEPHIKFVGLVPEEDLVGLYNCAHVYVFPSFYEGFGLPPLEAFACHTPVACSKSSSLPEICGKDNALFFDPKDIEQMAQVIHTACTNEKERKELIERGAKRVLDFSWDRMARETLAVYNEVLHV